MSKAVKDLELETLREAAIRDCYQDLVAKAQDIKTTASILKLSTELQMSGETTPEMIASSERLFALCDEVIVKLIEKKANDVAEQVMTVKNLCLLFEKMAESHKCH